MIFIFKCVWMDILWRNPPHPPTPIHLYKANQISWQTEVSDWPDLIISSSLKMCTHYMVDAGFSINRLVDLGICHTLGSHYIPRIPNLGLVNGLIFLSQNSQRKPIKLLHLSPDLYVFTFNYSLPFLFNIRSFTSALSTPCGVIRIIWLLFA